MGTIALLHLLPESIAKGGIISLVLVILGLTLPHILEKITRKSHKLQGLFFLFLSLVVHTILENAGLSTLTEESHLGVAIILHNFPVGLIVFSKFQEAKGSKIAFLVILSILISALIGFFGGEGINKFENDNFHYYLEAFIAATLLHVVFEHKTSHDHSHHNHAHHHEENKSHEKATSPLKKLKWGASLGALLGLFSVVRFVGQPDLLNSNASSLPFLETFLSMSLESAPALLLAYFLSGFFRFLLNPSNMEWMQKGGGLMQSIKGVLFGLPLPICSCGVLPLYKTLVTRGVPPTAAMGFLIATPELGLDAILLSLPLLGRDMAFIRFFAAFFVAVFVAFLVGRFTKQKVCTAPVEEKKSVQFSEKIILGFRYGFIDLFDHTMPWVILGLFLASVAEPLLGYELLHELPDFWQVPLFTLIGIPMYVCASGATPIAAIAIHKGISAGSALAFLIAGPATNITTFGILSNLHGKRIALFFGLAVIFVAMLVGWTVDSIPLSRERELHSISGEHNSIFQWISLGILFLLFAGSVLRLGPRGILKQITEPIHVH